MRASHDAAECAVAFPKGGAPWSVERGQLMPAKGRWAQRMLKVNDVARLARLIRVEEHTYVAANSTADQQLRLICGVTGTEAINSWLRACGLIGVLRS